VGFLSNAIIAAREADDLRNEDIIVLVKLVVLNRDKRGVREAWTSMIGNGQGETEIPLDHYLSWMTHKSRLWNAGEWPEGIVHGLALYFHRASLAANPGGLCVPGTWTPIFRSRQEES